MMNRRCIPHLARLAGLLVLLQLAGAAAAEPASPGVEVKFFLEPSVDAALIRAARDGFDAGEQDYEPELEWGFQQETLTFSNEKTVESTGGSPTLPAAASARTLAVREMPGTLRRLGEDGWAKRILSGARVYGPVEGRRWTGSHPAIDDKIAIEVWVLPGAGGTGTEHIVEVSFKKKQRDASAVAKREALLELLRQKRWLLEGDVLKTALILERGTPTR